VTQYRVPRSGTHPISDHHDTFFVNHIPDIGINVGYNIGCPYISDMISRCWCQYRVPISGVPMLGYDDHRYRSQYWTLYRVLFLVPTMRSLCKAMVSYRERKIWPTEKNKILMFCLFLPEQKDQGLLSELLTPCRDSNPEPLPSDRHALLLSHQAK
jgi:hypothetical protein